MKKTVIALALIMLSPVAVLAFGSHDNECIECHGVHTAKGAALIGVDPLEAQNPSTGTSVVDVSSLCLGCHSDEGGILEINLMATHPIGIIPKRAQVPSDYLSVEGTMTCTSCHDPHPSNPNYMYLRAEVDSSSDMGVFCEICHADKRER